MAGQELALLEQDPVVVGWREKARTFEKEALALEVDSDAADAAATSMMGIGAAITRAAEARRIALKKPHLDANKSIDDFFRRELRPFTDARPILEQRSLAWRRQKAARKAEADAAAERERLKAAVLEQEALQAERAGESRVAAQLLDQAVAAETTAKTAAVVAAQPVTTHVVTPMGSSAVQKRWTFKVLDLAQVPREYFVLDETAVRAAIRAGARDIPGLEIYQDESLAVRG